MKEFSFEDCVSHEMAKLKLLQQAIDAGFESGVSARSFESIIMEAEAEAEE